jgi:hypothetical protein
MILYVDGDSYSQPGVCVDPPLSYWSLFGKHINADKIVNYAYSGKSMSGMVRCAVRFAIDNKDHDVFFLLGFSHLARFDVGFQLDVKNNPNPAESGISSKSFADDHSRTLGHVSSLLEADLYANIVMLDTLLNTMKFKHIFHNMIEIHKAPDVPMLTSLKKEVNARTSVVNFFGNTYFDHGKKHNIKPVDFDKFGWVGHHGPEVNGIYADYLIQQYQQLYG